MHFQGKTFEVLETSKVFISIFTIMEPERLYHIYNRGNNKEAIFKEERNYQFFLNRFKEYLSEWVDVHAYCLMPNHFHFLIEIQSLEEHQRPQLERQFRNFFISYAKAINKAYDRTGSLFQYKFKRKLINTEPQYALNIAYIHYNPVKAQLCERCEDWRYSSFQTFLSQSPTLVQREKVLSWFGGKEAFLEYHDTYFLHQLERMLDINF